MESKSDGENESENRREGRRRAEEPEPESRGSGGPSVQTERGKDTDCHGADPDGARGDSKGLVSRQHRGRQPVNRQMARHAVRDGEEAEGGEEENRPPPARIRERERGAE